MIEEVTQNIISEVLKNSGGFTEAKNNKHIFNVLKECRKQSSIRHPFKSGLNGKHSLDPDRSVICGVNLKVGPPV